MAYQTRARDPLLDSETKAILERRSQELLGLAFVALGLAVGLLVWSYSPEDPSWLSASDAQVQNLLGRPGASIASPLFVIVGHGAWAIAAVFLVWGVRLIAHVGAERIMSRIIFAPIAIALSSVYASTLVPSPEWTHSFGLGGLFGDTMLGALLGILPIQATLGLKILSFVTFFLAAAAMLFSLGVTRPEIRSYAAFSYRGLIQLYCGIRYAVLTALGASVRGSVALADRMKRDEAEELVMEAEPFSAPEPVAVEPQGGLMTRLNPFVRKVEPELPPIDHTEEPTVYGNDRISARVTEAVNARVRRNEPPVVREEPALQRAEPQPALRAEPQLTAPAYDEPLVDDDDLVDTPVARTVPSFETGRVIYDAAAPVVRRTEKKATPSRRAMSEAQPTLNFDDTAAAFELPPLNLLANGSRTPRAQLSDEALEENARMLESVLDDYGVKGDIVSVRPGPVVTMYELEPAPGLKASRVVGLADDIARSMSALSARVSTVPGRSIIGIELPNETREMVMLREIFASRQFDDGNQRLPLALGKDIGGDPIVANLAKMPHLLIAGTTGSGKSVAINTMILSLLYRLTPEECRLIMIDPKMLELSVYDGIPHLLSPVVTDPKKAVVALKWVVGEMEERYRKMSKMGVRNIEGYNGRVRDALSKGEMFSRTVQTGFDEDTGEPVFETEEFAPEAIPYIVVIVDEMADLMMVAGKEIEACIQRLAQMARASGIHLIMATQRPSVDVITGTIKANFPTRISFQVTSKVDSRTILGEQGAEQLLGMGDMLYMAGGAKITRVHGPFVSDEEVEEVVNHLKSFGAPEYITGVVDGPADDKESDIDLVLGLGGNTDGEDALYDQAVQIVIQDRKCSTSYIQRKLAIGYNKAARLVEQMEENGLVSPANHVGKREILVPEQA
ncbi:MAG: DNA translocase FtsK [Rhodobacteraceae bacterium]|nr:DNA translocase FtsK [Paracoccaceae bacterium]